MANVAGSGGGGSKYGQRPNDAPAVKGQEPLPAWIKTPTQALNYMRRGQIQSNAALRRQGHTGSLEEFTHHFLSTLGQATVGVDPYHPLALLKAARAQAVKVSHPSAENPPSLGRNVEALLSGSFGLPRMGVNDPIHPRAVPSMKMPRVPKGETTPETGGDLGRQVREGLRGAKQARKEQDVLYSAERSKRAGAAEKAMTDLGGVAGYEAALGQLKGELPKLHFGGLKDFDQTALDELFTHIQNHPTLRPYEKIRTQTALKQVIENGRVPAPHELKLFGRVFGQEVSSQLAASATTFQNAKRIGLELLNVPRALMASFDLSAPFRQGLMAGVSHPVLFAKNFGPMLKAFGSENAYQGIMDGIASRPTFQKMQESGLALTDLGALSTREEQFMSNYAEHIPIVGRGVRGSGRAYIGFLNKMRADVFDQLVKDAEALGRDTRDPKLLGDISKFVNSATGRGDLRSLNAHTAGLNVLFFSPRLLFSRLNFLNPAYYASLDPFVRREALKAALSLVGTVSTVLTLAKAGGADVNVDPRNADFAKMKFGNTRLDVLGGFQQPVRMVAQLVSGKIVSSTTGKTLSLGPQGPGKLSRYDIAQRFVESKLAPVPSFVKDVGKQTNSIGQPLQWDFSANNPAFQRMVPLLAQDAYSLYKETGSIPAAIGGYGIGAFGIGIQSYAPKAPAAKSGGYGSRGSTGGSRYGQRGAGGGSAYGSR